MLKVDDYRAALELISSLAPDFIHSVFVAKNASNTPEGKEYAEKAAYILAMSDIVKTMNAARHNFLISAAPQQQEHMRAYSAKPRTFHTSSIYNPDEG